MAFRHYAVRRCHASPRLSFLLPFHCRLIGHLRYGAIDATPLRLRSSAIRLSRHSAITPRYCALLRRAGAATLRHDMALAFDTLSCCAFALLFFAAAMATDAAFRQLRKRVSRHYAD